MAARRPDSINSPSRGPRLRNPRPLRPQPLSPTGSDAPAATAHCRSETERARAPRARPRRRRQAASAHFARTPAHEKPSHSAATETPAPFESSEPAPKPAPAPAAEPTPPPAPSTPRPAQAESPALQAAENKLAEAGKLPLTKQPLEELLAEYQGLSNDANLSLVDRRIVAVRIGQLHRNIEIAAGLKSLEDAKAASAESISAPKPEEPTTGVYNPSKYDLVGQLITSGVYNGDTGPRLYRLVEPASMRTLAYVQNGRQWSPRTTLGRIVGIIGETRYDPALKLRIIDVKQMDVLEPTGSEKQAPAAAQRRRLSRIPALGPMTQPSSATGAAHGECIRAYDAARQEQHGRTHEITPGNPETPASRAVSAPALPGNPETAAPESLENRRMFLNLHRWVALAALSSMFILFGCEAWGRPKTPLAATSIQSLRAPASPACRPIPPVRFEANA